jgi:beta-lactamase regulating signal transducer with metallopeptidase domain
MLRVFNNRSSELRHRIWTITVCSMLSMPLLTFVLPTLPVTLRLPQQLPATAKVTHVSDNLIRRTLTAPATSEVPIEQVAPGTAPAFGAVSRFTWASLAFGVYAAGLIVFVTRFCLGWFGTRKLLQHSRRVEIPKVGKAYESDQIAAPVTIGIFAPRIILPATWRTWPEGDLHAILVHETEHRRRHHLLTSFVSHINCCLFWFHPLAWWLDRKLAVCAEETCDDAAIRSVDSPQRYAAILVDMAKAVHLRGARLSWTAVGMKGTGALTQRVDRIIAGRIPGPPSFTRAISATMGCILIILVFATCRGQSLPTFAEEQQALERVQSREREHQKRVDLIQPAIDNAEKLATPQAAELEAQLAKDPDNFYVRLELLAFYLYRAQTAGMNAPAIIRNRRQHILWFIRSRPDDDLASSPLLFINTQSPAPLADPEGYADGKTVWLEQVKIRPSAAVLGNAAYFMQATDKEQSETFLLQAQQLQPDGRWMNRLAQLYASMILGATAINALDNDSAGLLPISTNTADQHGPLAGEARRKLDETKDFTCCSTSVESSLV